MDWRAYGYDGFGRLDFEAGSTTPPVPGEIATSVLYQDGEHIVAEAKGTGFNSTTNGTNIVNWYTYSDATDDLLAITPQAAANDPNAPNAPNGGASFSAPSQTAHYSVHTDHQGSVRAITDQTKQIVNAYAYDAYGNAEEAVESLSQRFRYTGREWDGVAQIYHYRARAYDAETGRFLQEDPLGFTAGDHNLYRYVFNDPVNVTDPSGLIAVSEYQQNSNVAGTASGGVSALGQRLACLFGSIASVVTVLEGDGGTNVYHKINKSGCGAEAISEKLKKQIIKTTCRAVFRNGADVVNKGKELEGIIIDTIVENFIEQIDKQAWLPPSAKELQLNARSDLKIKTDTTSVFIDVKGGKRGGLTKAQRRLYKNHPNLLLKFLCPK